MPAAALRHTVNRDRCKLTVPRIERARPTPCSRPNWRFGPFGAGEETVSPPAQNGPPAQLAGPHGALVTAGPRQLGTKAARQANVESLDDAPQAGQLGQLFHKQSVEIRQDEEKRCCHGDGLTLQREHDQVPDRDTTTVVKEKQIKWAGGRNGNFNARRFAEPNQSLPAVESIVNDFLRGDYGALYVGCERAFELGEVDKTGAEIPSWGRVYSVRTWVIEALVKNRAFLKQQSGTMKMTVDASPWVCLLYTSPSPRDS